MDAVVASTNVSACILSALPTALARSKRSGEPSDNRLLYRIMLMAGLAFPEQLGHLYKLKCLKMDERDYVFIL